MRFPVIILSVVLTHLITFTSSANEPYVGEVSNASRGPAVLLKNGQVLPGETIQQGDHIIIKQQDGGELRLPIDRVACWGPDLRALFDYRSDMRGKPSVRSHLVEARWCINNGLRREAAQELMAVYKLSPENAEAKRLEERLRKPTEHKAHVNDNATIVAPQSQSAVAFSGSTIYQFARTIQPILMNRCGTCHDSRKQLDFRLVRLGSVSRVSSKITEQNLQHLANWIDAEKPLESPLFDFAQRAHGGAETPPLGKAQTKARESLRWWLMSFSPKAQKTTHRPIGVVATNPFAANSLDETQADSQIASLPGISAKIDSTTPLRLPPVVDPFDPEVFNRKNSRN